METMRSRFGLLITVATFGALVGFLADRSPDSRNCGTVLPKDFVREALSREQF
jgi:hypothetical protein